MLSFWSKNDQRDMDVSGHKAFDFEWSIVLVCFSSGEYHSSLW